MVKIEDLLSVFVAFGVGKKNNDTIASKWCNVQSTGYLSLV